jgi:hypothetical protein
MPGKLHVVGVRHHSPACARLVEAAILALRPKYVLIEGPADMNGRLDELTMQRRLPVAIYSYLSRPEGTAGSWTPFCDYSPEWVALKAAKKVRAEARFIDLPAWSKVFLHVRNRYADRRLDDALDALCHEFGAEGTDALWDHLFEQPAEPEVQAERMRVYFEGVRAAEPAGERDRIREAYMAACVAWALDQCSDKQSVVVVCGGYHAPFLEAEGPRAEPAWPELPVPEDGTRFGSYLVPYNFHRLDSFTGYQAGMPSPGWYQVVWEEGPERAPEAMLEAAVLRLRARKQVVSAADLISAWSLTRGLQQIRGHRVIARVDLLDGIAGALLKEAVDQPFPWSRRGGLAQGTAPALVEVVAAFSGEREGKLTRGTPLPPLVEDVRRVLADLGLTPPDAGKRTVELRLDRDRDRDRSRALHRLRVLEVPGFERTSGPKNIVDGELGERWTVARELKADAALIEAGAYGATLDGAATARLEERLLAVRDQLDALVQVLVDAVFTGVDQLAQRALDDAIAAAGAEPRLEVVGEALSLTLSLWRHDALMGSAGSKALATVIEAAFDRGLWLYESIDGPSSPADTGWVKACVALRDTLRHAGARLGLDEAATLAVMRRRSRSSEAPPALRGGALGFLWSSGAYADPADAEAEAISALKASSRVDNLGDFLSGLFALAREEVMYAEGLIESVDAQVSDLGGHDFLVALPALRLAFSWFPPREKERIAKRVFKAHDLEIADVRGALKLRVSPEIITAGVALDARVTAAARRYGLDHE